MMFSNTAKHLGGVVLYAGGAFLAQSAGLVDALGPLDQVFAGTVVVTVMIAGYRIIRSAFTDSTTAYKAAADDARQTLSTERAEWETERIAWSTRLEAERDYADRRYRDVVESNARVVEALRAEIDSLRARVERL